MMTFPPSRELTPHLFLELLYGVIVFEYKHVVKCGNPVSYKLLAEAFASVAKISRRYSALLAFPCHDLIQEYGLDTTEDSVWPNVITNFQLRLFPRNRNPKAGEDAYLGYKTTETGIVIPIWGSSHIQQFHQRYICYVPVEWKDDIAVIVYELRKDLGIRGSGGKKTVVVHGSLIGLLKFSWQYPEVKTADQKLIVANQPVLVQVSDTTENHAAAETSLVTEQPTLTQISLTTGNIAAAETTVVAPTPIATKNLSKISTVLKECAIADQLEALWTPYSAREANPRFKPENTELEEPQERQKKEKRKQPAKQEEPQKNHKTRREWVLEKRLAKQEKPYIKLQIQEMARVEQEMYLKWVPISKEVVSKKLFIAIYYELVIFELTATHGAGAEVPDEQVAIAFAIAAEVLEKNADVMFSAAAQIRERGLDDPIQVRKFFKDYRPQLFCSSTAQAPSLLVVDIINAGYEISTNGIILPTWSAADERAFLVHYDASVPFIFKDDLAVLVWELQNHLSFRGSGGWATLVHGRLQGVTKFRDLDVVKRTVYSQHDRERRHRMERLMNEKVEHGRLEQLGHWVGQSLELTQKEQEQDRVCPKDEESGRYIKVLLRIDDGQEELERTLREQERSGAMEHLLSGSPVSEELICYKMNFLSRATRTTECRKQQIMELRDRLTTGLNSYFQQDGLEVLLCGSYATGLSDNSSNADFSLVNSDGSAMAITVVKLANALLNLGFVNVAAVGSAHVPFTAFDDPEINLSCNMSLNQFHGALNSKLIETYRRIDGRLIPLWFAIRHMARKSGILSGKQRDLTSNTLVMMMIAFLQTRPQPILPKLQRQPYMREAEVDVWDDLFDRCPSNYVGFGAANTETCATLLKEFYRYFGYDFQYGIWEINPRAGAIRTTRNVKVAITLFQRRKLACAQMCIMDPFILNCNLASRISKKNVRQIKDAFRKASDALTRGRLGAAHLVL